MARRLVISLALMALMLLLTGASFANLIDSIIVFGPGTSGSFSITSTSVTFSTISGPASSPLFGNSVGAFTLAQNALTISSITDEGEMDVFKQPDAGLFTVTIGSDSLAGSLSLDFMQTINSRHAFFEGTYSITSSTSLFSNAGYPVGRVVDLNFVIDNANGITILSAGEITPVAEPRTLILMGSGLLSMAGIVRRKLSA
jgi:hypothetical protein